MDKENDNDKSLLQQLEKTPSRGFVKIILRNYIHDLNCALDELQGIYNNLFTYGIYLSGFQFVGLQVDQTISNTTEELSYFLLALGFFCSLMAALVSFITIEYLKALRNEEPEFILAGCMKYALYFWLSELLLILDSVLFVVSLNMLVYTYLRTLLAVILNVVSVVFSLTLGISHYLVIVRKQTYMYDGKKLKRRLRTKNLV
jgi:hypothetical protein